MDMGMDIGVHVDGIHLEVLGETRAKNGLGGLFLSDGFLDHG